jgi:ribosome-associated protein
LLLLLFCTKLRDLFARYRIVQERAASEFIQLRQGAPSTVIFMVYNYDDVNPDDYILSKSQVKRDMHALQALGESLIDMNEKQLASIPLSETMLDAIYIARKLPPKEARRRQIQYIGRLMREGNHEEIKAAVDKLQNRSDQYVHRQHQVERYRDMLIDGDKQIFQTLVTSCPGIDVQHLRQLIRSAQKEREENKPPASARKLFAFIREQFVLQD